VRLLLVFFPVGNVKLPVKGENKHKITALGIFLVSSHIVE
jgi:hypothetical protein